MSIPLIHLDTCSGDSSLRGYIWTLGVLLLRYYDEAGATDLFTELLPITDLVGFMPVGE